MVNLNLPDISGVQEKVNRFLIRIFSARIKSNLLSYLTGPCFTGLKNSEAVDPACRKRRLLGTYQLQSDC